MKEGGQTMHYVKHFNINGVDTKQVACIELQGVPNAATEGAVGVLGIDTTSSTHDVYKCVAVNGAIYTWELLSSGLSIIGAVSTGGGEETANFLFADLLTPDTYVIKVGDLIFDSEGYLYRVSSLDSAYCTATYTGTHVAAQDMSNYYTKEETYSKSEVDNLIPEVDLSGYYTKEEIDSMLASIGSYPSAEGVSF